MAIIELSVRELSAVLAALRHWQEAKCPDFQGIASRGGASLQLSQIAVNSLCERINTSPDALRCSIEIKDGAVIGVIADGPIEYVLLDRNVEQASEDMVHELPSPYTGDLITVRGVSGNRAGINKDGIEKLYQTACSNGDDAEMKFT